MHWWLPNDEYYPPIIRSIRRFVEERTSQARDVPTEDLRDMKAIFSSMKLDDGKTHIPLKGRKGTAGQSQIALFSDQSLKPNDIASERIVDTGSVGPDGAPFTVLGYPDDTEFWID